VNYKAYNLDQVLAGDLDGVLDALSEADRAERLAASAGPAAK
jgi:peptide chain release factor 1